MIKEQISLLEAGKDYISLDTEGNYHNFRFIRIDERTHERIDIIEHGTEHTQSVHYSLINWVEPFSFRLDITIKELQELKGKVKNLRESIKGLDLSMYSR